MSEENIIKLEESEVEVIDVNDAEIVDIELAEVFGTIDEANNALNHALLHNRDIQDQHPITAITGLRAELDEIESLKTVYSDEKQQADYYLWHDENPLFENRDGLFVSMHKDVEHNIFHSALCCIEICDGSQDVFGVTVAEAGFVGGQEYVQAVDGTKIGRDRKYGLVVHSGLVGVRRETNVGIGDYVVPNIRGEAEKSDGDYGYLVTALSEVNGVPYAIISLVASSTLAERMSDSVQDLSERMTTAEYNITSVTNVANSAYALAKDAKENAEVSSEYIEEKIEEVLGRMDAADGVIGNLSESVNNACESAALAKVIAEGAVSSANAMKNEAVEKANEALNEATNTRKELESKIEQINIDLDNTNLELQATKESIESTKTELQGSIDNAVKDLEAIEKDLEPLATWPEGSDVEDATGIAGFVARANEDSATLASMVIWKGDAGESLAGFVQEATNENATVKSIASYERKDKDGNVIGSGASGLIAQVDDNKASISLIAEFDGNLAGLQAQVDKNTASVATLASHVIGDYVSIETWVATDKDTSKIYYAEDTQYYYYYDNGWKSTEKSYEAGLDGTLSGVQQIADDNKAQLDAMVLYDKDGKSALAGLTAYVDENSASLSTLAKYNNDDSGNKGIAGLVADVDNNTSTLSLVADYSGTNENGQTFTGLAGLRAQVDGTKSDVAIVSDRVAGDYVVLEEAWSTSGKDPNKVYYVKAATEDAKNLWYYYDKGWTNSEDPYYAGLPRAMAGIQAKTDDNSASIESLTSWQGDTNTSMANLQQKADANGAKIEALVADIDKYAVGEYSQAYGLTLEQAKSILSKDLTVYVPTVVHTESYGSYAQEFSLGYYYTWDGEKWAPSQSTAVSFSSVHIQGNDTTPYWLVTENDVVYPESSENSITYDLGGLYLWEDNNWVKVASVADNTLSRAVSKIKQTADSITIDVTNMKGDVAESKQWITDNDSNIQSVVSWKNTVKDDVESIATIKQTADDAGASVAQVAAQICGEYITLEVEWSEDDKETDFVYYTTADKKYHYHEGGQWKETDYPTEAGLEVNAASIVTAIVGDESSISLLADHINLKADEIDLTGYVEFTDLSESGKTTINGDNITTGTIDAERLNLSGVLTTQDKSGLVSSVEILYARSSSATECTDDTLKTEWSTTAPEWVDEEYMWQKTITTYADGHTGEPVLVCIQGAKGGDGDGGYTIILTNESHVFAGYNTSYATGEQTASTKVLAYKGDTSQSVTIISVNGRSSSTDSKATGITGLSFKCSSTFAEEEPTITFTTGAISSSTTRFSQSPCSIPIVIEVDGKQFTKTFSCSIAFKGSTGAAATSYWMAVSDSVVHKNADGALSPTQLTINCKSKTGTSAVASYSCRLKIDYTEDGTTYQNLYTSTSNESSKVIDVGESYTAVRCQMYYAGGTTTLLDEQTIPIISDGEKGDEGIYVATIIEQYYLSTSAADVTSGTWTDIVNNATLPIEKGKYRFRRQKYIWSGIKEGTTEDDGNGHSITYSAQRLDETDQRILAWCSSADSIYVDGGAIYANSITSGQLSTDAIQSVGDENGNGEYEYTAGDTYSKSGSKFDLANGDIITPSFSVIGGDAYIKGHIDANSGEIGGWEMDDNQFFSQEIRLYSTNSITLNLLKQDYVSWPESSPIRISCGQGEVSTDGNNTISFYSSAGATVEMANWKNTNGVYLPLHFSTKEQLDLDHISISIVSAFLAWDENAMDGYYAIQESIAPSSISFSSEVSNSLGANIWIGVGGFKSEQLEEGTAKLSVTFAITVSEPYYYLSAPLHICQNGTLFAKKTVALDGEVCLSDSNFEFHGLNGSQICLKSKAWSWKSNFSPYGVERPGAGIGGYTTAYIEPDFQSDIFTFYAAHDLNNFIYNYIAGDLDDTLNGSAPSYAGATSVDTFFESRRPAIKLFSDAKLVQEDFYENGANIIDSLAIQANGIWDFTNKVRFSAPVLFNNTATFVEEVAFSNTATFNKSVDFLNTVNIQSIYHLTSDSKYMRIPQIQAGACTPYRRETNIMGTKTFLETIVFSTPFDGTPTVFLSAPETLPGADSYSGLGNANYSINVVAESISEKGFSIYLNGVGTNDKVDILIKWIAIY